jgi:hypothetical protein
MKHVVGDDHWHSPMACVSVVSKRAVSEGGWKWSDYYFSQMNFEYSTPEILNLVTSLLLQDENTIRTNIDNTKNLIHTRWKKIV